MTDHPLSESAVTKLWDDYVAYNFADWFHVLNFEAREAIIRGFRAAFDIGREYEQANLEDSRPWEPLNGRKVDIGDEVRLDWNDGITTTIAVVDSVDEDGDPYTHTGELIDLLNRGTWYIRRSTQKLPTIPGTIIIKSDELGIGIKDTVQEAPRIYRDRLILDLNGKWQDGSNHLGYEPDRIIRNTWKVFDPQ